MYIRAASASVGSTASLFGVTIRLNARNPTQKVIPVAGAQREVGNHTIF